MTFSELLKKPDEAVKIYKSLVDNPKAYFELINTKESLESSILAVAAMALLGVIPSIFTPQFTVFGVFIGTAVLVVFTLVGCGVLHLIRGVLKAEGNFIEYLSFSAWMQFLFLPQTLAVSFVSHLSNFFLFNTLMSGAMIALYFYAFIKRFKSDVTVTSILAVLMLALTILPSLFVGDFDPDEFSEEALKANNPEFAKKMENLEKMKQDLEKLKKKHEESK